MTVYNCECCEFKTTYNANYDRHITTSKHLKKLERSLESGTNIKKIEEYACKYCGQIYKHKSSIYKHIKYSCMQNKDEDLKELVRLLNLQLEQKEKEMERIILMRTYRKRMRILTVAV